MPSSAVIVRQLSLITNEATPLAIAWHVIIVGALLALLLGWRPSPRLAAVLLALPIVFGLVYPELLATPSALAFLYAAPVGLIPCPTLSLVLGFGLLAGGFGTRAWSTVLASAGIFYGVFGVARLGVYLDIALIVGAVALPFTRPGIEGRPWLSPTGRHDERGGAHRLRSSRQ